MDDSIREILEDIYALDDSLRHHETELKEVIETLLASKPDTKFDEGFKADLRATLMAKAEELKAERIPRSKPLGQRILTWIREMLQAELPNQLPTTSPMPAFHGEMMEKEPAEKIETSSEPQASKSKKTLSLFFHGLMEVIDALMHSWILPAVAITLVFTLSSLLGWHYYQKGGGIGNGLFGGEKVASQEVNFTLRAAAADENGIDPQTTFVLGSSKNLSEKDIEKVLVFDPPVPFSVKKLRTVSSAIDPATADESAGEKAIQVEYEIKLKEKLPENQVIKVAIGDTEVAEREYSWAFPVKAPFGVLETTPKNQATFVPKDTMIEVVFNRPLSEKAKSFVAVQPKIDAEIEIREDRLFIQPKSLSPETVYAVTMKKGLPAADDETLGADHHFSFETADREGDSDERFSLNKEMIEVTPDNSPVIELSSNTNAETNTYTVNLFRFSDEKEFMQSYLASQQWELGWTRFSQKKPLASYRPDDNKKFSTVTASAVEIDWYRALPVPEKLSEGYYFFEVSDGKESHGGWITCSNLSHYVSLTADNGLLWLYDFAKKQPVSGAVVKLKDNSQDKNLLGTTDNDGLIQFKTPDALTHDFQQPSFFQVQANGFQPLVLLANRNDRSQLDQGDAFWDYVATDRNVYQPSDTLRYWAVAKSRTGDLKDKTLQVGIYKEYYDARFSRSEDRPKPLAVENKIVSAFDTLSGSLDIKGFDPGYYYLIITTGNGDVVTNHGFEVATYTKPAYHISVSPSKSSVYTGDTVSFKIKASFFDGTPVTNGKIRYTITGNLMDDANAVVPLDANGETSVSYTPKYQPPNSDKWYETYPTPLYINVAPELAEEGNITASASVEVFGPDILLSTEETGKETGRYSFVAKLNKAVLSGKQQDEFGYTMDEYLGDPVDNYPLSAKLVKITYVKEESGKQYDYITKTVQPTYTFKEQEETVEELSGRTDRTGTWTIQRDLATDDNVHYKMRFEGKDQSGKPFIGFAYAVRRYQAKNFGIALNLNGQSADASGQEEFAINDPVQLHVDVVEGEKPQQPAILFYRYQNNIQKAFVVKGYDAQELFADQFVPSVRYRAAMPSPNGFDETNDVTASFKEKDRELKIDLKPNKERYQPKQDVSIDLTVTDQENRPVESEVNMAVVDEAMIQLAGDSGNVLFDLYQDIYTFPTVEFSQYASKLYGDGAGGCFVAGTPVRMGDGTEKHIEDIRAGDAVLTLVDKDARRLARAVVQSVSSHEVDSYLLVNDMLKVTSTHRLFLNGSWEPAGNMKVGDSLVDEQGRTVPVQSIQTISAPRTNVYNILVSRYHTYFAGGVWVHNEGKDGRTQFVDVVKFEAIKTDKKGKAEFSFKTPDNLTNWRVTARGYDPKTMQAGQRVTNIPVTLPLFVDTTLSDTYLSGDAPLVRLRFFGEQYQAGTPISYSVSSESLSLKKEQTTTDQAVYVPLGQLPAGTHELTVAVKQGSLEDSLTRTIVVTDGYAKKRVAKAVTVQGGTTLEGSSDRLTDLVVIEQGKGMLFEPLAQLADSSGLRSDQVAARHYARLLLKKYFDQPLADEPFDLSEYQDNQTGGSGDKGLALLPYASSNLEVSAKLADLAGDVVPQTSLAGYFQGELASPKTDIHRAVQALYGLASVGQSVLPKIALAKKAEGLTTADKIYVALAQVQSGDKEGARAYYEHDIRPFVQTNDSEAQVGGVAAPADPVKVTATAGVLAAKLSFSEDVAKFWKYTANRDPAFDLDVLEQVMMAHAVLAEKVPTQARVTVATPAGKKDIDLSKQGSYSLVLSPEELKRVRFEDIKGAVEAVTSYEVPQTQTAINNDPNLALVREYQVNGTSTTVFSEGDLVRVKLTPKISATAKEGLYQVIDTLPSGLRTTSQVFRLDPLVFEDKIEKQDPCQRAWLPNMVDGNRVYFTVDKNYAQNNKCNDLSIFYTARVVSKGTFTADSAILQPMNYLEYSFTTPKQKVEIK